MNPIRILLADDHEIVRAGVKALLATHPGFQVVAEAANGREAISKAREINPDIVVMDISMPEMDGLEATRRLREANRQCAIIALTVHEDKQYFFAMLEAGASGYITKESAGDELIGALEAVAAGHVYLQPALARWLLEDYRLLAEQLAQSEAGEDGSGAEKAILQQLSQRERQVLELVADGLTTPRIGEVLGISPKTISRHRERIMNKLNLHSTAELIKFACRAGMI